MVKQEGQVEQVGIHGPSNPRSSEPQAVEGYPVYSQVTLGSSPSSPSKDVGSGTLAFRVEASGLGVSGAGWSSFTPVCSADIRPRET